MNRSWKLWTGWALIAVPITAMLTLMAFLCAGLLVGEPLENVRKVDKWASLVAMAFVSYIPMAIGAKLVTQHYQGKKATV